MIITQLIALCN